MKPNPMGQPPMAGPIQCTSGYEVQAKINRPMGINQHETIMGIKRYSAGGFPLNLAETFR